jgi:hypothetical protein
MTTRVKAEFEIASWDETPFDEGVGVAKLTEALVAKKYSGGIDATSTTKWLMTYAPDKTATFVGIERMTATSRTAPRPRPCASCRAPTNSRE